MFSMHLFLTLLVLLAAVAMIGRMIILEKRPRTDLNPRLFSTTQVLIASCFVALLALIHLINLAGVHTGR
jgi:hypothetical protein